MKQTAVDWLIKQLIPKDQHEGIMDIIEEAKEMEKEQIIQAYQKGVTDEYGDTLDFTNDEDGEQYYTENYGK